MNGVFITGMLAAIEDLTPRFGGSLGRGTGLVVSDVLKILVAVLVLTFALLVWARYFRRRRRHHRHRHHHHSPSTESEPATDVVVEDVASDEPESSSATHRHRRHRVRRRDHRPRNPTLAETGGLPPLHNSDLPPPGP